MKYLIGCGFVVLTSVGAQAVQVLEGPTLTMNPNGTTPLAGEIHLVTDEPVAVQLTIRDGMNVSTVALPQVAQTHQLPVLGLKPQRSYTVDVDLTPGGFAGSVATTTPSLPEEFPTLELLVSDPPSMEPGFTLIDCMRHLPQDNLPEFTAIVDEVGEVVWYTDLCFNAAKLQPNGFLYYRDGSDAVQQDLLGNTTVLPLQVPVLRLHHDLLRTPHGTWLSLMFRSHDVDSFPSSTIDPKAPPAPATLRDDSVVEFLPDGSLRREWMLIDMIDPMRVGYDSLNPTQNGLDWTHANAVHYRREDDAVMVSVRHQDAVVNFSRESGELRWILGTHANWAATYQALLLNPIGTPFRWQYHQHSPMWTGSGNILLFDNGNYRASPFDGTETHTPGESFSRGVEFEIDESAMEVHQVWEYGEQLAETLYSFFISDADWQPTTGNRIITFGGISHVGGSASGSLGLGGYHVRIVETTDAQPATSVFDLRISDPASRVRVYRTERISSLYAQQQFFAPNGVGDSLRLGRPVDAPRLTWAVPDASGPEQAAEHYLVYTSATADSGFGMFDSTANTMLVTDHEMGPLTFFKVVAANLAGTSSDVPAP